MLPGPDQIVACPHCGGLATYRTLLSGNTFGLRSWSDGKQEAPRLPQPPAVARCRHCRECFWLADAAKVGQIALGGDEREAADPSWRAAERVEEPSEGEYHSALAKGLARDRPQEVFLRTLAWWRGNDPLRDGNPAGLSPDAALADARRANLAAIVDLLDPAMPDQALMRAEALRELGEFDRAIALLDGMDSGDDREIARQLRELAERGDRVVRELKLGRREMSPPLVGEVVTRSALLRTALRAALWQQVPCVLLSALVLDGGGMARACGVAVLGFWAMAGLLIARRPAGPRPGDLAALRWGFGPIFVGCLVVNELGRR